MSDPTDAASADVDVVKQFFASEFSTAPHCVIKAPGRVNLIGEHIDYNGYPVLPIALEQSTLIAVSLNDDDKIRLVNYTSTYAPFTCDVSDVSKINKPPSWYDYVLCGIYGVQQELELPKLHGMNFAVWGKVPPSAGLSSSSSLVCAAALATLTAQTELEAEANSSSKGSSKKGEPQEQSAKTEDTPDAASAGGTVGSDSDGITSTKSGMSMKRLAQMCAAAEKYVGTQGGGMDQAACLLSKRGCAQLISFNPLNCDEVTLPKGATFVVANSLSTINKAATNYFNCRVVECKLACNLLAKASGLNCEEVPTLYVLQQKLTKSLVEMLQLVKATLHAKPYTKEEICNILNISTDHFVSDILNINTRHLEEFHLQPRALHVFSEAKRVYDFKTICDDWRDQQGSKEQEDAVLRALGAIMAASHLSARDDYDCSHPALDRLVVLAGQHALGARLTGAGWGGCTVALVAAPSVPAHCARLRQEYYAALPGAGQGAVFASYPAQGATVIRR